MRVLFLQGGLTHYYNLLLNKLNNYSNVEVILIIPKKRSNTIGKGVYLSDQKINFKIIRLNEIKKWYRKVFFKDINCELFNIKPDIIVAGWPYILGLFLSFQTYFFIKKNNIKVINRDIPWRVPMYRQSFSSYCKFTGEPQYSFSLRIYKTINFFFAKFVRKYFYNKVNAHMDYIDDAYEIVGSYGVKKEKIFITYNSPDTDILFQAKKEAENLEPILLPNKYRIIHVGRLIKWKRVDLLIKVIAKLKKIFHEIELIIIGDGPEKQNLINLSENIGIRANIRFIGAVYDPILLGRYFIASSIYVLAGIGGLSINEAMCFGKPVVCSVGDGTEKKLVRDNFNGKYFKNGNEEDLFEKILYLFNNYELVREMGENSQKIIIDEINIHSVLKRYIETFKYVLN